MNWSSNSWQNRHPSLRHGTAKDRGLEPVVSCAFLATSHPWHPLAILAFYLSLIQSKIRNSTFSSFASVFPCLKSSKVHGSISSDSKKQSLFLHRCKLNPRTKQICKSRLLGFLKIFPNFSFFSLGFLVSRHSESSHDFQNMLGKTVADYRLVCQNDSCSKTEITSQTEKLQGINACTQAGSDASLVPACWKLLWRQEARVVRTEPLLVMRDVVGEDRWCLLWLPLTPRSLQRAPGPLVLGCLSPFPACVRC